MSDLGAVLVDCETGYLGVQVEFLERLGHPVQVCPGPPHATLCPILSGDGCPLMEEADGVVFALDLDRPQHRAILAKYQELLAEDVPVRAVVLPGQDARYADLLSGVQVWTHEPSTGDMDGFSAQIESARG